MRSFIFLYYWILGYVPDKISLINDKVCCRYGYYRRTPHQVDKYDQYDQYDSLRYYKYPAPMWFNRWYFKKLTR